MTIRQLAQHLGVSPLRVGVALASLAAPPHGTTFRDLSPNYEIPIGGYELAVAAAIIKEQDREIERLSPFID